MPNRSKQNVRAFDVRPRGSSPVALNGWPSQHERAATGPTSVSDVLFAARPPDDIVRAYDCDTAPDCPYSFGLYTI